MLDTTAQVIDALGGIAEVAKLTGRNYDAVEKWRNARGVFPPSTFLVMTKALQQRGASAPLSLWRMANPDAAQHEARP